VGGKLGKLDDFFKAYFDLKNLKKDFKFNSSRENFFALFLLQEKFSLQKKSTS
jgi:hypothetical protein